MNNNENLNFKIFRVSNRGSNVLEKVSNQTYAVNVPSELRDPTKIVKVEVIAGSMTFSTNATFNTYAELGVSCNLVQGFDAENNGGFNSKNYNILFTIDTSNCDRQNTELFTFHKSSCGFQFITSSIPEKLEFSSVGNTGGNVVAPIVNDGYLSFILKLTYYDK
jgi:hypothetical protein